MLLFNKGVSLGALGLFLMIFFGLSCHGLQSGDHRSVNLATDLDEIESRLRATVAFLDPETERIFCSGFFVSPRQIISAAHCFEPSATLTLPDGDTIQIPTGVDPTGETAHFINYGDLDMTTNRLLQPPKRATIVHFHRGDDLVILDLETPLEDSRDVFRFAETQPRVGSQAYGIGHPYRLAWSFENGIISRIVRSPGSGRILLLQASVPVAGGNSGGPLLDSEGNVIGMALAYIDRLPHLSIFISAEQIQSQIRVHWARQVIMAYEERQRQTNP